ncbi:unnamed protein product [Haemonchus placei]|uniref:Secreted protein n=1 Tax=Haemonchus placei TaxID=6290 RepID=A0A0N4VXL7_HAEPC|nr:unnamed protein product [Haemonchus placei]
MIPVSLKQMAIVVEMAATQVLCKSFASVLTTTTDKAFPDQPVLYRTRQCQPVLLWTPVRQLVQPLRLPLRSESDEPQIGVR